MKEFWRAPGYSVFPMFLLSLAIAACGRGGGGGTDGSGLSLTDSSPSDGAIGVTRTGSLVLNFSATLDTATVTTSALSLHTATSEQEVTVTASGSQLMVTPNERLFPETRYELDVTQALRGAGEEQLRMPLSIHFTTSGAWLGQLPVGNNSQGQPSSPRFVADADGNALVVWLEDDGDIWSSNNLAGTGWAAPQSIENSGDAHGVEIALGANGDAIAVWRQNVTDFGLWSNYYVAGTGWTYPQKVHTANVFDERVAMDDAGNALAIWADVEQGWIWWSRYTAGSGWGAAAQIDSQSPCVVVYDYVYGCQPEIAMDTAGNAVAVWVGGLRVRASRYEAGGNWSPSAFLQTNDGVADSPQVAVGPTGDAIAVWRQSGSDQAIRVWSSRYRVGGGWSVAELVSNGESECPPEALHGLQGGCWPEVALDAAGNAFVVWQGREGTTDVWGSRYTAATGWGQPQLIASVDAYAPRVVTDSAGNSMVFWYRWSQGPIGHVLARRYVAGNGWGTVATLNEAVSGETVKNYQVGVAPDGNIYATWVLATPSSQDLWWNRFE